MLESISLQNFQSHKKTEIEFSSGVNMIIGTSDSGKTAILRALNLLISNKPSGDSFRSNWGGDTIVEMIVDGVNIKRIKTDKDNSYIVGGKEFKGFGQNVPDNIADLFHINDISIQHQMDAPFLISDTSGEVARKLNKITNLSIIDKGLFNINKRLRSGNADLKALESNIKDLQDKIEGLKYIDKAFESCEALYSFNRRIDNQQEKVLSINLKIEEIKKHEQDLKKYRDISKAEKPLFGLETIWIKMRKLQDSKKDISQAVDIITKNERKLQEYKKIQSVEDPLKRLEIIFDKHDALIKKHYLVSDMLSIIKKKEYKLDRVKRSLEEDKQKFKELMPDECPLCGSAI